MRFEHFFYNRVETFCFQTSIKTCFLDIFRIHVKNSWYVEETCFFQLSTRKGSLFLPISILCRRFETSQRCLSGFWQFSSFFGIFWFFLKNNISKQFNSLTANALKTFYILIKSFFSHPKKDNLVESIFGHL